MLGGDVVGYLGVASWHSNEGRSWITPINGVRWGDRIEKYAPEGIKTYGGVGAQLDTRGADVGEENPYNTGDGSTGYPHSGGDPTNAMRCAWEGMPMSCGHVYKIASWQHVISKPQKLPTGVDSKINLPNIPASGAGSHLSFALAATGKPKIDYERGTVIELSHVPEDDPESEENRKARAASVTINISEFAEIVEARKAELMNSPTLRDLGGENDCLDFVAEVDKLAGQSASSTGFVKALYDKYANSSGYTATGFKDEFVDKSNSDSQNQVRHATGAIAAGYTGGTAYFAARGVAGGVAGISTASIGGRDAALAGTLAAFNSREVSNQTVWEPSNNPKVGVVPKSVPLPPTEAQRADIALNGVAVPIGFRLGNGEIPLANVAEEIRRSICK